MELKLNTLLSDLVVVYHKIQNFHWYAKGENFYPIHEKLDVINDSMLEAIDDVAETMLMLELMPAASLKEYLDRSSIKEMEDGGKSIKEIMTHLLADFEHLKAEVIVVKNQADDEDIYLVSALMDNYLALFSKNIWMVKQSLK